MLIKILKKTDPIAFENFKVNHNSCSANYKASDPNKEVIGAKRIFSRSIDNRKLRYVEMYSDGDSKTYPAIKDTYVNSNDSHIKVQKKECVCHVQKRVGTRLRKLKKDVTGLKGKLTEKVIDRLQNFYGIAISSNPGNLKGIQDNAMAVMGHAASFEKNYWHNKYPKERESWCKYQADKANGTKLCKPGKGLDTTIIKHIKSIFVDLCKDELLKKCLDCKTQNQNKSFNGTVWNRLQKTTYIGYHQFSLGVYDAVAVFNNGRKASIDIYENMNMRPRFFTRQGCRKQNRKRLYFAEYQNNESAKKRRKKR